MSLKCCNRLCQTIQTLSLYDTHTQQHRMLIVGRCKNPRCGCLKAEFIFYDVLHKKFIHQIIPTKDVRSTIQQFKKAPYLLIVPSNIKHGTKTNMHWKYHKNGCIYDFNNMLVERLIASYPRSKVEQTHTDHFCTTQRN